MKATAYIKSQDLCHHCGDQLADEAVEKNGHHFCCKGCSTVFDILNRNDLCEYYELDPKAGINPGELHKEKFAYLDDERVQQKLLSFKKQHKAIITFQIPQMHCMSCIWLLERLYRFEKAIESSRVNFNRKELQVNYDPSKLALSHLVYLLSSLGYEPHLSLASEKSGKAKPLERRLWLQIGIAGFAFGNIMLFSVPEYFDSLGQLPENFKNSFGFISLLLSLPVLFFSDLDYFKSALAGLRKGAFNLDFPLSLGMISLFIYSSYSVFFEGGMGYFDSFAGLVFFLLLGKAFQNKTINQFSFDRDYRSFFPLFAIKLKNGNQETIPIENLKVGDRILVQHQGLIPSDGYLLKGNGVIDYSFVTGESIPETKQLGEVIYAGGRQVSNNIEIELKKTVSNSYLTSLWNNEKFQKPKEKLNRLNDNAGRFFTLGVVLVALIGVLMWLPDISASIRVFASVLIIACPCALALSAPFAFGNGIRILSRSGFYLKNTSVLEALSRLDHLVFDKTGTLTDNHKFDINYSGRRLNDLEVSQVRSICSHSSHPMSKSIFQSLVGQDLLVNEFRETPGKGIEGIQKGDKYRIGNWDWVGQQEMEQGVFVQKNGTVIGKFMIEGHVREEMSRTLDELSLNYDMSICSGDNKASWKKWLEIMPSGSNIKFDQDPQDKAKEIQKLQKAGNRVCMIGDGLNDGLALKTADVGLAFTEKKDTLTPASDGVLSGASFYDLDKILKFSRGCSNIVRISFAISILYNCIGLYFALIGILSPVIAAILMPLSSITIVAFTTGSTGLYSRILGLKNLISN